MDAKIIAGITSISSVAICLIYYWRQSQVSNESTKRRKLKEEHDKIVSKITEDDIWNTALFFPDYFPENEDTTTRRLIWYLEQATTTIDVCCYGFAFKMLQDTLVHMSAKKGVKIRVLTNRYTSKNRMLRQAGIRTRAKIHLWTNPQAPKMFVDLMHHKFAIIDGTAVIVGSLNWTMSSITENWENVMITTEERILSKLSQEFERIWAESDRSVYCPNGTDTKQERRKTTNTSNDEATSLE